MNRHPKSKQSQSGLTLVELMVAMTIGLVLISGTLFVYTNARAAYATNESYALMQENARFALSLLEPDVQLAGYWGLHRDPTVIIGSGLERAASGDNLTGIGNDCDENWVVQFDQHVEGFNDVEASWNEWDCMDPGRIQVESDIFAIRRAGMTPAAVLEPGQLYMASSEAPLSEVFIGDNEPTSLPDSAMNFPLVANAYYVSPYSIGANTTDNNSPPSLRRIQLVTQAGAPLMLDTEITTGVEDMQVQYGIGPADVSGVRGGVNVYVSDMQNLTPPNTTVRSMRIWLLMRADREEFDYIDDKQYQLGDKLVPARNDGYRRLVVSKTIFFRNLH
ncbi:MAG: PilW family protein [Gammaproteobacteria bacterium]